MRAFWNRGGEADDDQSREEYEEGDESAQDADAEGDAEDADEGERTEDAALQARIQEEARKLAAEEVGKIRVAAQKRGLDWTGQDFGVTDYQRAQQAFGFGQQQERQQPAVVMEADDLEPEVDEWDADGQKQHVAWQIRQARKEDVARIKGLEQMLVEDRLTRAMEHAAEAVKRHALPVVAEYLEHPDFEEQLREALMTQDPRMWSNAKNLAALATLVATDLDHEQIPKKDTSRDESGRFSRGAQQRNQIGQMLPTRGTGQPPEDDLTEGERRYIRMGRLDSPEEARALRQNTEGVATFETYDRYLNRQKARARK